MKIKTFIAAASLACALTAQAGIGDTVVEVQNGGFTAKSYNLEYKPGTPTHVYFDLINPIEVYGFQCDINASPGLGITKDSVTLDTATRGEGHTFTTSTLSDGTIVVSAINFNPDIALSGNEGKLFDIGFIMPETTGNYTIDFSYIILATNAGRVQLPDFSIMIVSNPNTTGLDDAMADDEANVRYFDINGMQVARPSDGRVYLRVSGSSATKQVLK